MNREYFSPRTQAGNREKVHVSCPRSCQASWTAPRAYALDDGSAVERSTTTPSDHRYGCARHPCPGMS